MKLIGLDIGTTGCKACLFERSGELLGRVSREYSVAIPHPGWAEQDAEDVWRLAQECLRALILEADNPDVGAIGLSVQGEAVMPLDQAGRPMRPMILGMDTRTTAQNDWLAEKLGSAYLFEKTGMPVHTINTTSKLLWIKQNEPEIWKFAQRFVLYEDFLIERMTGQPAISKCLASRTQMLDLHAGGWSDEVLTALDLDPGRLSPVVPSGEAVGRMKAELASELGFRHPPLITTGGHDQACGALGVGLIQPGLSLVSTGTAEVVEVALDRPVINEILREGNVSVYAHVVPEMYLAMTLNHSGGMVLRWFRDLFCGEEMAMAKALNKDAYEIIFNDLGHDPSPLLLQPHFSGSGTPFLDTRSKGVLAGLTFSTTKKDIAKAILEGLTFELRHNLEILQSGGVALKELRAIGGGARSTVWLQMKADITGVVVTTPKVIEAAAWGAAILGGFGAGYFTSVAEAVEQSLFLDNRFSPNADSHGKYQERYRLYRQLYPAVKDIIHEV